MSPYLAMSRSPILRNALNGMWLGLGLGVLAFGFVTIARPLMPEIREGPGALPLSTLAFLYLVAGPALGFLGGALRTWLPGRLGSTIIAMALGAAVTAIVIPFHPHTKSPWGPVEYMAIALIAVMCGVFIGARHR
jgi:hypothetical protein